MKGLGRRSSPTLPITWLKPRITAVAVAKRRAATTPPLLHAQPDPREAGIHARVVMPSTVSTVPAAIASVNRSPRNPIANAAANNGVVQVKVATTVAPGPAERLVCEVHRERGLDDAGGREYPEAGREPVVGAHPQRRGQEVDGKARSDRDDRPGQRLDVSHPTLGGDPGRPEGGGRGESDEAGEETSRWSAWSSRGPVWTATKPVRRARGYTIGRTCRAG